MVQAGPRRTKYYKDNPEAQAARNASRLMAQRIAGNLNQARWLALTADERREYRAAADLMIELGGDFTTAQKAEATEKRGFVYVITNAAFPGYVKIGRAFNPDSRLAGYQTGDPHRGYKLYAAVYFEDCHFAEEEIHARLHDEYRNGALGEWFNISPFMARHNINKLRSII